MRFVPRFAADTWLAIISVLLLAYALGAAYTFEPAFNWRLEDSQGQPVSKDDAPFQTIETIPGCTHVIASHDGQKRFLIDSNGRTLFEGNYETIAPLRNRKECDRFVVGSRADPVGHALIDAQGKVLVPFAPRHLYIADDYISVQSGYQERALIRLLDRDGKEIFQGPYMKLEMSTNGRVWAQKFDKGWRLLEIKSGKELQKLPPEYVPYAKSTNDAGGTLVRNPKSKEVGYLDARQQWKPLPGVQNLISTEDEKIWIAQVGPDKTIYSERDAKAPPRRLVRNDGSFVTGPYTDLRKAGPPGYFIAKLDGKAGVIASDGRVVVPFQFKEIQGQPFPVPNAPSKNAAGVATPFGGLLIVKTEPGWNLWNVQTGKDVFEKPAFSLHFTGRDKDAVLRAEQSEFQVALWRTDGTLIADGINDADETLQPGVFLVRRGWNYSLIDKQGKALLEPALFRIALPLKDTDRRWVAWITNGSRAHFQVARYLYPPRFVEERGWPQAANEKFDTAMEWIQKCAPLVFLAALASILWRRKRALAVPVISIALIVSALVLFEWNGIFVGALFMIIFAILARRKKLEKSPIALGLALCTLAPFPVMWLLHEFWSPDQLAILLPGVPHLTEYLLGAACIAGIAFIVRMRSHLTGILRFLGAGGLIALLAFLAAQLAGGFKGDSSFVEYLAWSWLVLAGLVGFGSVALYFREAWPGTAPNPAPAGVGK